MHVFTFHAKVERLEEVTHKKALTWNREPSQSTNLFPKMKRLEPSRRLDPTNPYQNGNRSQNGKRPGHRVSAIPRTCFGTIMTLRRP